LKKAVENPEGPLRKYLESHYVPENMFLVVATSTELKNKTKEHIENIMDTIPKRTPPIFPPAVPVFDAENKGVLVKIKDDSLVNELTLSFNVPILNSKVSKSIDYI
jgi:secreted Zn-dependent insulinase-like peptidase